MANRLLVCLIFLHGLVAGQSAVKKTVCANPTAHREYRVTCLEAVGLASIWGPSLSSTMLNRTQLFTASADLLRGEVGYVYFTLDAANTLR
jgi:hypothetical protein